MPSRVAVVLAGGASRRFGADKLAADLDGTPLLDVVLSGLPPDLAVVVVGPPRGVVRPDVVFVREEPVGGGPAAALVTGVAAAVRAGADQVVVVPGDAPAGAAAVVLLLGALGPTGAAVGVDGDGVEHPLQVALSRAAALEVLAAAEPDGAAHRSARTLVPAGAVRVPLPPEISWDVDTPAQLAAWRVRDSAAAVTVAGVVESVTGLVVVDGRSGSGKSTLALAAAVRTGAVVVDGDDFYSPRLASMPAAERDSLTAAELADEVVDWRRLRAEALEPLLAGGTATWRPYDWDADDGSLAAPVRRRPGRVVVLEGVYSARPELADLVSAEVLVEVDEATRRRRLVERDEADPLWEPLWAAAEVHYFTDVRPPASFAVRVEGG